MPDYVIYAAALTLATTLPLAWKWQLGVLRSGIYALALSMIVAVVLTAGRWLALGVVAGTLIMWAATVIAAAAGLLIAFFRDPERPTPSRRDVIFSPADGRVVYLRPIHPGRLPQADKKGRVCRLRELAGTMLDDGGATAIGISMNMADVHVNRAPVGGRVRLLEHVAGTFGSLRRPEMLLTNERVTTVIETGDLEIAIVQIASRLVRRIVTFVSKGDVLRPGQRIGAIRFGSQVDLIIPARPQIKVTVQPGDRVVAGQTIMALIVGGCDGTLAAGSARGSLTVNDTSPVLAAEDEPRASSRSLTLVQRAPGAAGRSLRDRPP
jgi:phosphatidylserine decarboxylase